MSACHCGYSKPFSECCEPIITGKVKAATAEDLMRSRYSAFVTGNIDYIVSSNHESTRDELDKDNITQWANDSKWLGLEIVATENGEADDDQGLVEFKANYSVAGQDVCHHETSEFVKEDDGNWYYTDGEVFHQTEQVVRTSPKVGRNDPCICGSGKKYKKCCGR